MTFVILILFMIASFITYCMCVVAKRADETMEQCMKEMQLQKEESEE